MKSNYTIIDLQLFAEINTQTTTLVAEGNNLSAENKTYYDMTLIDKASPNLVHDQFGQKRPIPKNGGKTIEFRSFSALPTKVEKLTEGVTPDGGKLDVSTITATVEQYGYYVVQSDILELTAIDNTIVETVKLLGNQAGEVLDCVVRDALVANVRNIMYPTKSDKTIPNEMSEMDGTCVMSVDTVERVVTALQSNNAPKINGDYVAIVHPHVAYDLRRDPEWIDAHKYASPEEIYNGEIGKLAGVRFVVSSVAHIDESEENKVNGKPLYSTFFIGEGAYGVTEVTGGGLETIIKQKGSAGTADPLDQRSSIGWKALKTAEVLVPEYIIKVMSVTGYNA